jgi:hypothetical protein
MHGRIAKVSLVRTEQSRSPVPLRGMGASDRIFEEFSPADSPVGRTGVADSPGSAFVFGASTVDPRRSRRELGNARETNAILNFPAHDFSVIPSTRSVWAPSRVQESP